MGLYGIYDKVAELEDKQEQDTFTKNEMAYEISDLQEVTKAQSAQRAELQEQMK